jgi:hypothetical protein
LTHNAILQFLHPHNHPLQILLPLPISASPRFYLGQHCWNNKSSLLYLKYFRQVQPPDRDFLQKQRLIQALSPKVVEKCLVYRSSNFE